MRLDTRLLLAWPPGNSPPRRLAHLGGESRQFW